MATDARERFRFEQFHDKAFGGKCENVRDEVGHKGYFYAPTQDRWITWQAAYEAGRLAQREEDAKIAENSWSIPKAPILSEEAEFVARAIREARGIKEANHAR